MFKKGFKGERLLKQHSGSCLWGSGDTWINYLLSNVLDNTIMVLNIKIKKVGPQDNKYLHLHVLCWRAFVHENHRMGMMVGKRRKRTWLRTLQGRPARDSSDSSVSHCDHSDTFINYSYSEINGCGPLSTTLLRSETKQRLFLLTERHETQSLC